MASVLFTLCARARKQNRFADKAANQLRINGETITVSEKVLDSLTIAGHPDCTPAEAMRLLAVDADWLPEHLFGKGFRRAVIEAKGSN